MTTFFRPKKLKFNPSKTALKIAKWGAIGLGLWICYLNIGRYAYVVKVLSSRVIDTALIQGFYAIPVLGKLFQAMGLVSHWGIGLLIWVHHPPIINRCFMTNFKPEKSRSPEDWQELAVERVDSTDSNLGVGAAIIAGLVLGAIASPLTGVLAAALILYRSFRKTHSVNSAESAIRDYGCVAAFLQGNDLKDYVQQVGLPECVNQINWAVDRGHNPSSDAQSLMPKPSPRAIPAAERVKALAASATNAVNRLRATNSSFISQPPNPNDLIGAMSSRIRNHLIIGAQGSGKGLTVSNALDAIKAKHLDTTIFYIDPKGDEKETGYFTGRVDILKRTKALEQKPSAVVEWFKAAIKEFQITPGQKLLILDEATYLSSLMKSAGEGSWFKSVIMSLVSVGDSQGWNIWIVALNPNTDDIGVSGGAL